MVLFLINAQLFVSEDLVIELILINEINYFYFALIRHLDNESGGCH